MRTFIAAVVAAAVQASDAKFPAYAAKQGEANQNFTPLQVTEDGVSKTKYIASDACTSSGSTYTCPGTGGRGYIIDDANFDRSNPNFWTPNLLGGSVEWDADMSQHECGCFNTFYTVAMPGRDNGGGLWTADDFFYCDGNQVGGDYCPEFDL